MKITKGDIENFLESLYENEYSQNTIDKYRRDLMKLYKISDQKDLQKSDIIRFKEQMFESYKPRSINSILAAWN